MIAYKELFIGVFWFLMAHLVTFQLNGQFLNQQIGLEKMNLY